MSHDRGGVLEDLEPLLQGSDGDEAVRLAREESRRRHWLGVAASVGVGSAAIVAAMMFWGDKKRTSHQTHTPSEPAAKSKKPIPYDNAHDGSE